MNRDFLPRIVALELTASCNLKCAHCRASAKQKRDPNELTTKEIKGVIANIASFSKPIIILTGGEPLIREDVYEIADYATNKGLRVVLGTNATLIDEEVARKLKRSGVKRISVSIDCAYSKEHDDFRGVRGAFDRALRGIEACKKAGLEFQINTTVTKHNVGDLQDIYNLAVELGAAAHHLFLLVPTGRGKAIEKEEIPPEEYERVLNWMYDVQKDGYSKANQPKIFMRATCAPHYLRVVKQRSKEDGLDIASGRKRLDALTSGCMGGISFAFISQIGDVNPCGYLPAKAGNIRERSFKDIWIGSKLFKELRNRRKLKGKCGACEYKILCGGCRARAYARYGDYLAEEPYCVYKPKAWVAR